MFDFFERADMLKKEAEKGENEAKIRDELQLMFNNLFSSEKLDSNPKAKTEATTKIMSSLKTLNNFQSLKCDMQTVYKCNISKICDSITFSADLLLSEWQKRVRFFCDEEIFVKCSEKWLVWSILSLISNAVIYSTKKDITVKVSQNDVFAFVSVSNFGKCNLEEIAKNIVVKGKSLNSVDHFIKSAGGKMLFCCDGEQTKVVLKLPKYLGEDIMSYKSHDFSELLSDRLSPVYVALSDICFS